MRESTARHAARDKAIYCGLHRYGVGIGDGDRPAGRLDLEHVSDHGDGRAGDVLLVGLIEAEALCRVLQHKWDTLAVLEILIAVDEVRGLEKLGQNFTGLRRLGKGEAADAGGRACNHVYQRLRSYVCCLRVRASGGKRTRVKASARGTG